MSAFFGSEMIVLVVAFVVLVVSAIDERPFIAALATLVLFAMIMVIADFPLAKQAFNSILGGA